MEIFEIFESARGALMEIFEIFESARGAYTRCARRVVVEISGTKKRRNYLENLESRFGEKL